MSFSPSRVSSASSPSSPWWELLRVSALFSVPGDLLAGAAAAGARPGRRTLLATGSSLCLYEAGMALNDWADRDTDAVERPGRPIPSGRIAPAAALGAAAGLTGAGLALAAAAGRPSLVTATALAATVWAYDLHLKNTPAGPLAMACARALDVLQGAGSVAPAGSVQVRRGLRGWRGFGQGWGRAIGKALPSAALLGTHTFAVTTVSRHEAQGSSPTLPLAALGVVALVGGVGRARGTKGGDGTSGVVGASGASGVVVAGRSGGAGRNGWPGGAGRNGGTGRNGRAGGPGGTTGSTPAAAPAVTRSFASAHSKPHTKPVSNARAKPHAGALPGPHAGALLKPHAGTLPEPQAGPLLKPHAGPLPKPHAGALAKPHASPLPKRLTSPLLPKATALLYIGTAARPFFHAALNPSPYLLQRAVGSGIRAMIPLQASLAARVGAPGTGAAVLALVPAARRLSRKVSPT
ncbi:SCO3242 family prenyltransferase [Streptomyces chrestomyceticus]|uniref:SCO3242 family prenyltransferase n=1 Tax=Streptomyces chrestomyceticus TaxID=68185 RepID=UPI0036988DF1